MADGEEGLRGWWKVIRWEMEFEDTGERSAVHGEALGALVISEGRIAAILTGRDRADKDAAALFQSMLAYSGTCRVEDGKLVIGVDVAWHPTWVGAEQVRFFERKGDALSILTGFEAHPNFPGRKVRGVVSLIREGR